MAAAVTALLTGCASLPTNAPTARQVERRAALQSNDLQYQIVDIDAKTVMATPATNALAMLELEAFSALGDQGRTDLIRKGDTLAIRIFEVGVSLFASSAENAASKQNPVANAQTFSLQVKDDGSIQLPYVGVVQAAGTYPDVLARQIRDRLRAFSESPDVIIAITETVENSAYVSGVVTRSGRYRLTPARERLLDILSLAGGPSIPVEDAELRVVRGQKVAAVPLKDLRPEDLANVIVMPEDRIEILKRRRSYTVFGATERVAQIPFEAHELSLAEAVARAGGPSDSRADPRAVFLFRLERHKADAEPRPVLYRLNLMNAESYFLAQLFEMQDNDVILFANSGANVPSKFIGLLNQLFSPIVTASVLTNNNK